MCSYEGGDSGSRLEQIERELAELASQISAATCRWLGLVAEYDASEGWAKWGCRSCADWVAWRCGLTPEAAREHVRVARRLRDLPAIRGAFAAGELSYSKVRALTRVGDIVREEELLELARHATAAQLEQLVRSYRRVVASERAAGGGRPERWLRYSYDDDGSLLLHARLPAEEGALVVTALEAARGKLDADRVSAEAIPARDDPAAPSDANAAPTREDKEAPAETADHADTLDAMVDVSAETPTSGEERANALLLLGEAGLANLDATRNGGDRYQVVIHVDSAALDAAAAPPADADRPGTATRLRGARCELDNGVPLAADTARRLTCDATLVPLLERDGTPLSVGRKTRAIHPALRRALNTRDGGCRFPGCGARRFVDAHHIIHWADGGGTDLGNLILLCRHHHRLLHEGTYTVTGSATATVVFRRADGRRIVEAPAPPPCHADSLRERRPGNPRPIAPDACVSLSHGTRFDHGMGVDALLAYAPPAALAPG